MFNYISLPGPGNGGAIDPRGMLAQILAQAQALNQVNSQPNSGHLSNIGSGGYVGPAGVHQQVAQLASHLANSRLPIGQARPTQPFGQTFSPVPVQPGFYPGFYNQQPQNDRLIPQPGMGMPF